MLNRPLTGGGANRVTNYSRHAFQVFSKPEGFIPRFMYTGKHF